MFVKGALPRPAYGKPMAGFRVLSADKFCIDVYEIVTPSSLKPELSTCHNILCKYATICKILHGKVVSDQFSQHFAGQTLKTA